MVFCMLVSPLCGLLSQILIIIKTWLMYVVIRLHAHSRVKKQGNEHADAPQSIPTASSNDSFYFEGSSTDGIHLYARMAYRGDGTVETWLGLRVPGLGYPLKYERYDLVPLEHAVPGGKELSASGPLRFIRNQAMQQWTLVYDGYAWPEEGGVNPTSDGQHIDKRHHVRAEFEWKALSGVFDMDVHLDSWPLAKSMAVESWSPSYFKEMKQSHQTHYEQHGRLQGTIRIKLPSGGLVVDLPTVVLRGMRDHSFGARDWGYMQRWVTLFGSLKDGRAFHVTLVKHPLSKAIVAGYLFTPGSGFVSVRSADVNIDDLGGDGRPPAQFAFMFGLSNGRKVRLSCMVRDRIAFHLPPKKAVLFEQMAFFTIDGVEGEGIAEFDYSLAAYPGALSVAVGKDTCGMTRHPMCR